MSTEEAERVSVLTERIDNLIERLDRFEKTATRAFVTRVEFSVVQRLVFGGVAVVLTLLLVAMADLVLHR